MSFEYLQTQAFPDLIQISTPEQAEAHLKELSKKKTQQSALSCKARLALIQKLQPYSVPLTTQQIPTMLTCCFFAEKNVELLQYRLRRQVYNNMGLTIELQNINDFLFHMEEALEKHGLAVNEYTDQTTFLQELSCALELLNRAFLADLLPGVMANIYTQSQTVKFIKGEAPLPTLPNPINENVKGMKIYDLLL